MYLENFVEEVLSIPNIDKKLNSTFLERLSVSKKLLEGTSVEERSSRSPFFLNDLGVRYTVSPKEFTKWSIKDLDVDFPSTSNLEKDLEEANINLLPYVMDSSALLTGDFETIFKVVSKRESEILKFGSYNALIYSGTVAASQNSKLAYVFFSEAINRARKDNDINHVITAYHRLIITKLKRFHDLKEAQELLDELVSREIPKSSDKDLYMALYDNMLGLAIVMEPNDFSIISAKSMLINATRRINEYVAQCTDKNKKSQAERYKGQVGINLVQLELENNHYNEANRITLSNLEHVKKYSKGYAAEAYSVLAYTQFMLGEYQEALHTSQLATNAHVEVGNYDGVQASREMLINCYMKLGMKVKAKEQAQLILDKSFQHESIESKN
ncbi:tetratricopeptide repeat protein [Lactobacillus intestinalis]|uniref:tetratricopeptide repeat protein n=1 Tax=Lactobacillus intestinalis TaxID=151781 RepID=UPI0002CA0A93|nr:hypothetical protein [Lactobacillus intestinalis]KAI4309028.1 hypothetical protein C821_000704 [Lactobacillus intestinalis]